MGVDGSVRLEDVRAKQERDHPDQHDIENHAEKSEVLVAESRHQLDGPAAAAHAQAGSDDQQHAPELRAIHFALGQEPTMGRDW